MKKYIITALVAAGLLLTGCGAGASTVTVKQRGNTKKQFRTLLQT